MSLCPASCPNQPSSALHGPPNPQVAPSLLEKQKQQVGPPPQLPAIKYVNRSTCPLVVSFLPPVTVEEGAST